MNLKLLKKDLFRLKREKQLRERKAICFKIEIFFVTKALIYYCKNILIEKETQNL
jgi:hypothetical protein